VERDDDTSFDGWMAALGEARRDMWGPVPGWQPVEVHAVLGITDPMRSVGLAAWDSGSVVGVVWADFPQRDNLHLATAEVWVPTRHGGRGVGSALLSELEQLAASEGRAVLTVTQEEPLEWGGRSAGRRFAAHHGYEVAIENAKRNLRVPVPEAHLAALEADALPHATGYEILTLQGRWPEEMADARCQMGRHMSTDPPMEDFPLEEENWDVDRVRRIEALIADMDRTLLITAARERASRNVVGFSEITVPRGAPEVAYQWDTLVMEAHRGHRLGTLLKVANLRALAEASPRTEIVNTWNAAVNDPMISVNDALGCEVAGTSRDWQKRLVG